MNNQRTIRLQHLAISADSLNIVIASRAEERLSFYRLQIHDNLQREFRRIVSDFAHLLNEESIFREYEPAYKPEPHEILTINIADNDSISSITDSISDVNLFSLFNGDDEIIKNMCFYAIVLSGIGNRTATFFRVFSPKKEITRKGLLIKELTEGVYNKVEDKVFLFDYTFDCFVWGDELYILNVANFQRIFSYFEQLRTRASETIERVCEIIPIQNLEEFREACVGNIIMTNKIVSIAEKPYLNDITIEDIRETIIEFDLDVEILNDNGVERLVFDNNPSRRWLILKLLDDDYLGSIMTDERYEVNSKLRIRT